MTFSLPCGEQKRQNSHTQERESYENKTAKTFLHGAGRSGIVLSRSFFGRVRAFNWRNWRGVNRSGVKESFRSRSAKRVRYWEIIADNLSKAGWSLGWVSAIDSEGRTIWIVDAHRAATERASLCAPTKSSARLLNLNVRC